ncbi:rod-binding protein [Thalassoglobus sp.]|uniref:rod-binding protein n=1 Tax=Thalassoglobus sp. TaxID=2795869 RepID=UPI003AA9CCEA
MLTSPVLMPHSSLEQHDSTKSLQSLKVGREMESLFVSVLLKEMRQAGGEGGLFPGDNSDTLGGMFDMFLGQHIAESGGIGLAASLENVLK